MAKLTKISAGMLAQMLLLAASFLTGCGDGAQTQTVEQKKSVETTGPVEVTSVQTFVRDLPKYIEGTGSFEVDEKSNVAPKVSGKVIATYIDVGDFVRRGRVIARLDDRDARLNLEKAKLSEQQAVVSVRQAEMRLGIGKGRKFDASSVPEVQTAYQNYLVLVNESELAKINERRYAELLKTGDTSQLNYDQFKTQAETLALQVKGALKQYENAKNLARQNNEGIASAEASLRVARNQIKVARKAVADAVVYAPFSGSVDARPVSKGEFVSPSSSIATIVRTNPIKLSISLPEADAGRVSVGMGVSVGVVAYPTQKFAGRVSAIVPSLDADSRSIVVEADIDNSGSKLRPGMFGTARIVAAGKDKGIFVPTKAIVTDSATQRVSVYVIEDGVARLRVVQTGQKEEDEFTQIVSGVAENEMVITSNIEKLFDGVKVIR